MTSVPTRLLETIRSRCQTLLFFHLSDDTMARFTSENLGLGGNDARLVASLAGGSPGTAVELAKQSGEVATQCRDLQERVLSGELNPVIEALTRIKNPREARRAAKLDLTLLIHCLREVLIFKAGRPPCLATPAFVERMAKFDEDELSDRLEKLLDHEHFIDLNANVGLVVENALLHL